VAELRRCVVVVGGGHSVHVRIPAGMLRAAGYRVVLADLQPEVSPEAREVFDEVVPLGGHAPEWLLRRRPRPAALPAGEADAGGPIAVETHTRPAALAFRLWQGWRRAGRLIDLVRRVRPGALHFQSMTAGGMTAYYFLKRLGWPPRGQRPGLLVHLWGYGPRFPGIRRREIRALRAFDQIHPSSPAVARIYREHYAVPPTKLHVFVRGINLHTFARRDSATLAAARTAWGVPADKFVVIHNRHLHPMYRVDIAVEAFIALARAGHDVFLLLVRGSMCQPHYERSLRARLENAGLGHRVALLPPVLNAAEMATALQLAHASINCVPFDAFPVSILEAMYCGAVPVVRNLESYSQFVKDGQTAFAVEGSVESYVAALDRLIRDPALRARLANAGAALVQAEGSEELFRRRTLELIEMCWHDW